MAPSVEEAGICGTLLGVDLRAQFHDYTTHLGVGDLLAFWTDGVTERRHAGVLFGEQRLASVIEQLEGRSADEVVQRIDEAVVAFAPGFPTTMWRSSRRASRRIEEARGRSSRFPPGTRSRRCTSRGVRLPDVRITLLVTCLNDALSRSRHRDRARAGSARPRGRVPDGPDLLRPDALELGLPARGDPRSSGTPSRRSSRTRSSCARPARARR